MTDKLNIKDSVQNDIILKEFWRDNARFADLFNAVIFNGRQIIRPDELQELDTDISGTINMKNYGESPWDGPVCLSDMMYDMPDDIRNIFSDYKLNLVQMFDEQQKIGRNNSTI